jgi:hypothetical protein
MEKRKAGRPVKTAGRRVGNKSYTLFEDQQHVSADFVRAAVDEAIRQKEFLHFGLHVCAHP